MNITRKQAIKILDKATDKGDFDDWWVDLMDEYGLYDELTDQFPNIFDVFNALGITDEEMKEVGIMS